MSLIVITGANRGIGLQLASQLSQENEVIALVREASPALNALDVEVIEGVDVADDDLSGLPDLLGHRQIDVLINNAGVLRRTGLDELDLDAVRLQFEVNALGPLKVTHALLSLMSRGTKVAHVTSRMGSVADNDSGSHYGYRMSKAALNMAAKSMSVDLAQRGISVCVLHPGWVRTDMTSHNGLIDADESAAGLIQRINQLTPETTGYFWHQNGDELPW